MRNTSLLSKFFVFSVLAICSVLLGFVGVFALDQSMKLKLSAYFSPVLLCKIEYSTNNSDFITIFDNKTNSTYINNEYVSSASHNTVSVKSAINGGVTATFYLRLTNYNDEKTIRLNLGNFSSGVQVVNYESSSVVCSSLATSSALPVSLSSIYGISTTSFDIIIEEVFLVEFDDETHPSSNISNTNFYTSGAEDAVVKLNAENGSYLPDEISLYLNGTLLSSANYSYNSVSGYLTIFANAIIGTISVDCDGVKVYKIYQYSAGSEPTNGASTTYNYYVELGEYPQTYVGDALNSTLEAEFFTGEVLKEGKVALYSYNQTIFDNDTERNIQWFIYNGNKYVRTPTMAKNSGTTFSTNSVIPSTETAKWFKVEPLYWTIIGTTSTALSNLYYENNVLYTDALKGKPYKGGLLLLSELAIDGMQYSETSSNFGSNSAIYNYLNDANGNFAKFSGIGNYFSTSADADEDYILYSDLSTFGASYDNTTLDNYTAHANIFLLGGLYRTSGLTPVPTTQTYDFSNYFNQNTNSTLPTPSTPNETFRKNVGISSASDYALGHYTYTTSDADSFKKTWVSNANIATNPLPCPYWLRGGMELNKQTMFNLACSANVSGVSTQYIGVRPSLVLNLGI